MPAGYEDTALVRRTCRIVGTPPAEIKYTGMWSYLDIISVVGKEKTNNTAAFMNLVVVFRDLLRFGFNNVSSYQITFLHFPSTTNVPLLPPLYNLTFLITTSFFHNNNNIKNNKCSLFTINRINCTIYLPKGCELKKMKTNYKIEI